MKPDPKIKSHQLDMTHYNITTKFCTQPVLKMLGVACMLLTACTEHAKHSDTDNTNISAEYENLSAEFLQKLDTECALTVDLPTSKRIACENLQSHRQEERSDEFYFHIWTALESARNQKIGEAIAELSMALEIMPSSGVALNDRGILYLKIGNTDHAMRDFEQAAKIVPDWSFPYRNLAAIQLQKGNFGDALQAVNNAILIDSTDTEGYIVRANIFSAIGKLDESYEDYNLAINNMPNNSIAYFNRGTLDLKLGKYEAAILDYDQAILLNPDRPEYYGNRGIVNLYLGDFSRSASDLRLALKHSGKSGKGKAYYNLGVTLLFLDRYADAISAFYRSIENNQKFGRAHTVLSWILSSVPDSSLRNPSMALMHAKKAIALNDGASAHYSLASAYANLGQFDEAEKEQKKGLSLSDYADEVSAHVSNQILYMYKKSEPFVIDPNDLKSGCYSWLLFLPAPSAVSCRLSRIAGSNNVFNVNNSRDVGSNNP